jgi:predicted aldo/keto reductase-like oxidoreductase
MLTRRFGRTELQIPVFSTGGMRYQMSWDVDQPNPIDQDNQNNLISILNKSLELGFNHIESARMYGSSEHQLGLALKNHPRDSFILQTKVAPSEDPKIFLKNLELSFEQLQSERIDLFAFHGVNLPCHLDWILKPGGCLDAIQRFREEGRIGHIGFSTHGLCKDIQTAIRSDAFDYVNLHWYAIDTHNSPAIDDATKHDMGVFIISPNDKGGMLYQPTQKLQNITEPWSPMVFNDLFCLSNPKVHTLSLGVSRPSDFDEHLKTLPLVNDPSAVEHCLKVHQHFLDLQNQHCGFNVTNSLADLPNYNKVPHQVNLRVILMLWSLQKTFEMNTFAKMRYNLLGNGGHWFPGEKMKDSFKKDIQSFLFNFQLGSRLYDAVVEASALLEGEVQNRLSQSDTQ